MAYRMLSLLLLLAPPALLTSGCGGPPGRIPLVDGQGIFALRYNPPGCLAGRPELHVEVKTPQGWERVALEQPAEDEPDLRQMLMTRFEGDQFAQVRVEGRFTGRIVVAVSGHASRVLRVLDLDPPDESEVPQ
jgi:hypothetical protein